MTARRPVPRAWESARKESVQRAMAIIERLDPRRLNVRQLPEPLKVILYETVFDAREIISELTSVPAEGER